MFTIEYIMCTLSARHPNITKQRDGNHVNVQDVIYCMWPTLK
jgi:hypothetical protein